MSPRKPLPPIPASLRLPEFPKFVRHEGEWVILGPAWALPVGKTVVVAQYATGHSIRARIRSHIAERARVHTRHGARDPGQRYVLATFTNVS